MPASQDPGWASHGPMHAQRGNLARRAVPTPIVMLTRCAFQASRFPGRCRAAVLDCPDAAGPPPVLKDVAAGVDMFAPSTTLRVLCGQRPMRTGYVGDVAGSRICAPHASVHLIRRSGCQPQFQRICLRVSATLPARLPHEVHPLSATNGGRPGCSRAWHTYLACKLDSSAPLEPH